MGAQFDPRGPHPTPESIGPYKILDVIGSGGMGTVYRALQRHPQREVALKLIRPHSDPDTNVELCRRLNDEAELLGRLQNPGIARIYEAGTIGEGVQAQPYFVMELIRGEPLTAFADAKQLSVRQRLALFAKVCNAVQHAHQKGIIHRDLKPANILVTDEGQPKVLDFGVAKTTECDLQATTLDVGMIRLSGTLAYMSPEQAGGRASELDTRSDVYALGIVLYELLTGHLPHDLTKRMLHEAVRVIQEEEPTRCGMLNSALRGDIETIVCKALEKDRERRYQSAIELGTDIGRFLGDQPIIARPPDALYQLGKFARRHKAVVIGVATVFLVLLAGIVSTSVALNRESRQRVLAERAQHEAQDNLMLAQERERELSGALYRAYIAEAVVNWRDSKIGPMRLALEKCPPNLRNWEWGYLHQISDTSVQTLYGHGRGVNSVAFSPDGSQIVSGSTDGTLKIWDVEPGCEIRTLPGADHWITCVAFSPDGTMVASGSWYGAIQIWDVAGGYEIRSTVGHLEAVNSITFSPDGRQIVSASHDNTVKVWDVASGNEAHSLVGHKDSVSSVAYGPDGMHIISGSSDSTVKIWDAETGDEISSISNNDSPVFSVTFSPDGTHAVSAGWMSLAIWDVVAESGIRTLQGDGDRVTSVRYSPDGKLLVAGDDDSTLSIWDAASGQRIRRLQGHEEGITSIAISPDGTLIATGSWDMTIKLWAVDGHKAVRRIPPNDSKSRSFTYFAINESATQILATGLDSTIYVLDARSGTTIESYAGAGLYPESLAFSLDGDRAVSGNADGTLTVWNVKSSSNALTFGGHDGIVKTVAFSPDGTLIASGTSEYVKIWDAFSGERISMYSTRHFSVSIAFSPDGTRIVAGDLVLREPRTGDEVLTLQGRMTNAWCVIFGDNGERVFAGFDNGQIGIWNAIDGSVIQFIDSPRGDEIAVTAIAVNPDGSRIATGSVGGSVRVLDSASGDQVMSLQSVGSTAQRIAFSPDGNQIISGHSDGTIKIWDGRVAPIPDQ